MKSKRPTIAILSDQTLFRTGLKALLQAHGFTQVADYASAQDLRGHVANPPDVLLVDLDHEQEDTLTLVRSLRGALLETQIVVIGTPLRQGAADGAFDAEVETPKGDIHAVLRATLSLPRMHHASVEARRQHRLWEKITPRQRDVMRWLASGADNQTIGRRLRIGERAVKAHVSMLLEAFDCRNRTQLALLAARAGVRPPNARAHG
jgi:DNA-binding NarL/FixJ family response regulator